LDLTECELLACYGLTFDISVAYAFMCV